MSYQTLKIAADKIDALATALEASQAQVKVAEEKAAQALAQVAQVETTHAQLTKAAADRDEEAKAKRASLAKVAGDKLLDKGLLSSNEKRDQFVTELLSHDTALSKLAQLAEFVQASRLGVVVADETAKTASADDTWARHVQAANSKLGLR